MARTTKFIALGGLLVLALVLSACASPAAPTAAPAATAAAQPTVEPAAATAEVTIKGFAFAPTTLQVKVGTTVTWTNQDSAPHTITSDTGAWKDSPDLPTGQSFSFTFTQAGSYPYHCGVHPSMKASVEVSQ